MPAPLPPPARPPITLPARRRRRLELPYVCLCPFPCVTTEEWKWTGPTVDADRIQPQLQRSSPLKRPRGFASTTVPVAAAPAGIAVLPSTETALANVAVKV